MSEQDLRDCMKQAVWDEPPLDFDPDSFMARAEQLTKRRRALMSVGVATALIIATVATLPMLLVTGRNDVDSATGVTATSSPPSSSLDFDWPPNDAKRRNHTYAEDQPYLINMWVNVLSPALQRQGAEAASIGTWSPNYQASAYSRDSSVSDVLVGTVSYMSAIGAAQLDTTIAGVGAWGPSPEEMCAQRGSNADRCDVVKRPDGSVLVSVETGTSGDKFISGDRTVYHYRLDGSVVGMASRPQFVVAGNYDGTRVPLSFAQLAELATNEAIALEP